VQVVPEQVLEQAFWGISRSSRQESGIALGVPGIVRWRADKPAREADRPAKVDALLPEAAVNRRALNRTLIAFCYHRLRRRGPADRTAPRDRTMRRAGALAMEPVHSLAARDVRSVIHPFTDLAHHVEEGPLVLSRGDGVYVIDEQGRRYLEGMAGLWCANLGFSEARLVEAAREQMTRLPTYHLFGGKSHAPAIELAERLLALSPVPMSKVLFTCSGSEANDTALKLVRYYHHAIGRPEKRKVISRARAYHGVTLACASLTGLPHVHRDFDLPLPGILHTECPHHYRCAAADESEEAFAARLAAELERLIRREGPDSIGAFIAEPVMGAGGVIVPPATYFEQIQEVLRRYDVLLIADEVITGFGRTGATFGCERFGIEPDLITVAKGLSAGYAPIGGILISDRIYQAMLEQSRKIGTFGHGFTYSGHPVCAAVALRALEIYQEDDIAGQVAAVAPLFAARITDLARHPLVGHCRGVGLVGAIELMADLDQRTPFDPTLKVGARVAEWALEYGVILRPLGDVISFCPPLIIDRAEIDFLFDAVHRALDRVASELHHEQRRKVA
jgi:4-aminobutyrate--pyruvate transaminase